MSDLNKIIASRLIEARQRAGLSRKRLGNLMGINVPNVYRLEKGIADLRISTLVAAADAIGVGLDELCGRSIKKRHPPLTGIVRYDKKIGA
jgi:transcriptional regulator with XRE-family HTH domain